VISVTSEDSNGRPDDLLCDVASNVLWRTVEDCTEFVGTPLGWLDEPECEVFNVSARSSDEYIRELDVEVSVDCAPVGAASIVFPTIRAAFRGLVEVPPVASVRQGIVVIAVFPPHAGWFDPKAHEAVASLVAQFVPPD
jgi:hypothetical protein